MDMINLLQLAKGNPQPIFENMMRNNPQFRKFVEENKGKSPEEIARANGLDPLILKQFM